MLPVNTIPEGLRPQLEKTIEQWQRGVDEGQTRRLDAWLQISPENPPQLARIWTGSEYVSRQTLDKKDDFLNWLEADYPHKTLTAEAIHSDLADRLVDTEDEKEFDRTLRRFRRDMMLRILWRDFCRLGELLDTTGEMTHLAEATIQAAITFHYNKLAERFGKPVGKLSGQEQPLVVLGMGKLGGYELNVSSDIDLIFTYPEAGTTQGGRKEISNQEFFIKLGQKVINSIDTNTMDGFVFRVDMRLRPYGQSGGLALNFDAMEEYYQSQGRDWERYAMIKARVVSGDCLPGAEAAGEELMEILRPFTYRKYVDFGAIESMRAMKTLINREVQRRGISSDVKLGSGGIREVEFVVQVFQMIRGGRDSRLRERQLLKLLPLLEAERCIPEGAAEELSQAYTFLRNTEHAIQGYQDKQTQSLPVDENDQLRIAWLMGFAGWDDFYRQLEAHRQIVDDSFQTVIAPPEEEEAEVEDHWPNLWLDELTKAELQAELEALGFDQAESIADTVLVFKASRALLSMQKEGRARLDQFMPKLLSALLERQHRAETDILALLKRVMGLVEKILRRSAYLLLLIENPNALEQLLRLCDASSWIAEQLTQRPALLDELLDAHTLYNPPDKDALRDELRQEVLRIEWDDLEAQMEVLRYFRHAHGLRVAASEVTSVLPLMKVSDYLTWLAEVILEHVVTLAWEQMIERHGRPGHAEGTQVPEFIVVGYGKMGGIELGHSSDLDLVFVYDAESKFYTDGERSIDNRTFFTRLGQKVIHILNTQTVSGQLYEVDMRLRPSGNSGLLVCTLKAFEKYQRDEAWTWEHQALTRTRVVAGGARLGGEFEAVRKKLLSEERDLERLREEVVSMRHKMRDNLGSKGDKINTQFHLKQDAGGIVDIEFMVQYAVLAWANKYPKLTRYSDNIRVLESLQSEGLLSAQNMEALTEAYKAFRSVGHSLALQSQSSVVSVDADVYAGLSQHRGNVQALWQKLLGS